MGWEFRNPFKKGKDAPLANQEKESIGKANDIPEANVINDPTQDLTEMRATIEANDADALKAVREKLAGGVLRRC